MNDIEALEARIEAATTRIATAIAAKQQVAAEPGGDPVALRRLERVNVALRAQLNARYATTRGKLTLLPLLMLLLPLLLLPWCCT